MPALFDPFRLKSVTLRNHIAVSPMCQYMANDDGCVNEWHRVHYEGLARGGAGLVTVEATAVSPEGRITWGDLGLWNDAQAEALAPIAAQIKAYGAAAGIQLAHAGRKASANRPWEGDDHVPLGEEHAWPTVAPSAVPFGAGLPRVPEELSHEEIQRIQADTVSAAERAREIGMDCLQLHFAHGYLAQNFFSPLSNQRTDEYGGSAENRARYLWETFVAVRRVWPESRPLMARLSAVEYHGNDQSMLDESIDLLRRMRAEGLDMVDVSIGFNTPEARIPWGPNLLVETAETIKRETGLLATTSWYVSEPRTWNTLLADGKLDMATLGRPLLANPHWPYMAAKELGVEDPAWATLPAPYAHWLSRYR